MPKTKKATSTKKTSSKAKTTKKASAKKTTTKKKSAAKSTKTKSDSTENLELLNETGRRKSNTPVPVERRKRRRQIDPTTCERDYNNSEIEFMQAMDDYKQQSGRMFPTCSEILEVLINMGYRKVADAQALYDPNAEAKTSGEVEALENDLIESEF